MSAPNLRKVGWLAITVALSLSTILFWHAREADRAIAEQRKVELEQKAAEVAEIAAKHAEADTKLAEANAKLSEANMRLADFDARDAALEDIRSSANHVFVILDDEGRVLVWSDGAERATGWTREEIFGQTLERIMGPEDYQHHIAAIKRKLADKSTWKKINPVICTIVHKDPAKDPREWVVTARVVTSQKDPEHPTLMALLDRPENFQSLPPEHAEDAAADAKEAEGRQ
jgi:PAS domain S-box-containing protein